MGRLGKHLLVCYFSTPRFKIDKFSYAWRESAFGDSMSKSLIRIVFLVTYGLLGDPSLSFASPLQLYVVQSKAVSTSIHFEQQALAAQLASMAQRRKGDIPSHMWRLLAAIYDAIPGYHRFATTTNMGLFGGPILSPFHESSPTRLRLEAAAQKYVDLLSVGDDFSISPPDVFFLMGNADLKAFVDFAQQWLDIKAKFGKEIPIVIAGGRGRGTAPLIKRVLQHYQRKITETDEERLRKGLAEGDALTEVKIIAFVLREEGVSPDAIHEEQIPSTKTVENFTNNTDLLERLLHGRSHAQVALVTSPPLLLRAQATALRQWEALEKAGYRFARFRPYKISVSALSDQELTDLVGHLTGYPPEYVSRYPSLNASSELQGTQVENNPSVISVPLRPNDWVVLEETRAAFEAFLASFSSVDYDATVHRLVVGSRRLAVWTERHLSAIEYRKTMKYLEERQEKAQELRSLIARVRQVVRNQNRPGLLAENNIRVIDDLRKLSSKDRYFSDGQIACLRANKGKLVVVGDLHGDEAALDRALDASGYDVLTNLHTSEPVYIVFVGDYPDVGSHSLEVLIKVLNLFLADPEHVILLAGNHDRDDMHHDATMFPNIRWFFNELEQWLGLQDAALVYEEFQSLAKEMPVLLAVSNKLVVFHAAPPSVLDPNYKPEEGLMGLANNIAAHGQLVSGLVRTDGGELEDRPHVSGQKDSSGTSLVSHRKSFWVGKNGVAAFLRSIGASSAVRGHDRRGPALEALFDKTFLTVMTTDRRSPHNGYADPPMDGRIALFDLDSVVEHIDTPTHVKLLWQEERPSVAARIFRRVMKFVSLGRWKSSIPRSRSQLSTLSA
jgi:uncharacterized SAM-binding protein YcdF (DUF218 family)